MTDLSDSQVLPAEVAAIEAMAYVHSADLSPDGSTVAWCVTRIVDDEETITLQLTEVGEQASAEVRCGTRSYDPAWSPDGSRVAFVSEREGEPQIFILSVESMQVDQVTHLTRGVEGAPVWAPSGDRLAYTATASPTRDPERPYRVTRAIGWQDGVGLVDDATVDIFMVDLGTGQHTRLTADAWINGNMSWRPDADEIVYLATGGPDDWDPVCAVRAVGLDGAARDLARMSDAFAVTALPGGAVAITSLGFDTAVLGQLTVLSHDGHSEPRTDTLELDVNGDVIGDLPVPFANPDARILVAGDTAIVRTQHGDRLQIQRVALTGDQHADPLVAGDYCAYPLALASNRLLYATGTTTAAPDLWVRELESGASTRISFTAAENTRVITEPVVEELNVQAPDGTRIQAKFLSPPNLPGPLPTILLIHGGPKSAFGQVFFADAQLLCEAGFGVLMVNPRGSRGYGVPFATAITGNWGDLDYRDLMTAVDSAVEQGLADPSRLGVAGLSYGGFMSSWIVTHTDRFRAAVLENPVTNFLSLYGTSDIGLVFVPEILGGTPQTAPAAYARCSPISTANQCTTPTLIVAGEQDHRCPPEQSLQFYAALKRAECVTELLMLPGASHEGSISGPLSARRAQNEALLDWMNRHVRG